MAKKGGNVFRNPTVEPPTPTSNLTALQASFQAKWGEEGRPSPRTGTTGAGITKFGTQQLKYIDPAQPALGVVEKDVGATFRLGLQDVVKSAGVDFGLPTTFSTKYQEQRPATIKTWEQYDTSIHAIPQFTWGDIKIDADFGNLGDLFGGNGNGKDKETGEDCGWFGEKCWGKDKETEAPCDLGCLMTNRGCDCGCTEEKLAEKCTTCDSDKCAECDAWDLVCEDCRDKAGTCTPPEKKECDLGCYLTGRGCDCGCKDVKPCTTCDSTVCQECNAWDLVCEDCRTKDGTCTPPASECDFWDIGCKAGSWWDKYGIYIMIVGGLIGLGVLLYLLKPLFNMIGAFKGGSS